jgi:hypothetical protein
MSKSKKNLSMTKEALEQETDRLLTDHEAKKDKDFIDFMAKMVVDIAFREAAKETKLLDHPKGFHLEGGHTCTICQQICSDELSWYDQFGVKCTACQAAVDKKIIPPTLCKHPESFYSMFELEHCFNLDSKILRRWIKGGILKARVIPGLTKGVHATLFLIKDNKMFLPPKSLVKSGIASEEINGRKEYIFPIPWYRLCDDPLGRIKKYGIVEHMVTIEM